MSAYYNEIDPFAAAWLRNLIAAGHIAPGEVDERDIRDVRPSDLAGFDQCHFFAGIGGWSLALRMAGWPDGRPVWTGSCPCQPFSQAGRGAGLADERHLWPAFFHLIEQGKPRVVFGEQVASKDGLGWSELVQADLQGAGYAFRAEDICAAGVGAPHIRQRLWFVGWRRKRLGALADAMLSGRPEWWPGAGGGSTARGGESGRVGNADREYTGRHAGAGTGPQGGVAVRAVGDVPVASGGPRLLADADDAGLEGRQLSAERRDQLPARPASLADGGRSGPLHGFWSDADWIFCRDGKWRPVEPGTQPLAHGIPGRVGQLRAYGNAIVPEVAAEVIAEFMRYVQEEFRARALADLDATAELLWWLVDNGHGPKVEARGEAA